MLVFGWLKIGLVLEIQQRIGVLVSLIYIVIYIVMYQVLVLICMCRLRRGWLLISATDVGVDMSENNKKNYWFLIIGIVSCIMVLVISLIIAECILDILLVVFLDVWLGVLFLLAHIIYNTKK